MDFDVLRQVERPARYIGGEVNQIKKDLTKVEARVGLSYPDVYEIGMSHIGLKILYEILNRRADIAAERVYAPWPDMEAVLRESGQLLTTLENRVPLKDLHVLGFTLQYELSYTNLINVLELGGVPIRAKDRTVDHPVVIGGGPTAFNPEPIAPIMDAICLGDAEEMITEVVDAVMVSKRKRESRIELWLRLAQIPGVYAPGLYEVGYHDDGTIAEMRPLHGAPATVKKRILMDLDKAPYFTADLVPNLAIVHDRYGVEVQRGCMRGCRFCQAGYVYRPERQRSPETVRRLVRDGLKQTGTEEYALLSLSLGDYNCIEPLLLSLMNEHEGKKSAISTPSMRLESVTGPIMDQIARVRKTSFTIAPEAGSNRMRKVINKVIDEDVLTELVSELFKRGWRSLKMYFMLGLPTETIDDLQAIVDLGARCRAAARKHCTGPAITVSVSSFVPKSFTPFQWGPQITLDEIHEKQSFLSRELKRAKLNFRRHEATSSIMEGVYSRGDRKTAETLIRAHQLGARMDGWQEHHDLGLWDRALADTGLDRHWYNHRRRDVAEILPWDHIDTGMKREWLWDDWMVALAEGEVEDCSEAPCYDCGVCDHKVVHNVVWPKDEPGVKAKHRVKKRYIARSKEDLLVAMPTTIKAEAAAPESAAIALVNAAEAAVEERDLGAVFDLSLPTEMRTRFRVRFAKRGLAAMTSHLEVMTSFMRALKRAGIPMIFTNGMHPRMRLGASPPIPVGAWSEAEYFDLEVKKPYDSPTLEKALSGQLPDGLVILGVEEVGFGAPALADSMSRVRWELRPPAGIDLSPIVARHRSGELGELEIVVHKSRKPGRNGERSGGRFIRLDDQVVDLSAGTEGAIEIELKVRGGARLRDVLAGIVQADPFGAGWRLTKREVTFETAEERAERLKAAAEDPAEDVEIALEIPGAGMVAGNEEALAVAEERAQEQPLPPDNGAFQNVIPERDATA